MPTRPSRAITVATGVSGAPDSETHELSAEWCWPDKPLVVVRLDSEPAAAVDYLPASASAHWFLKWTAEVSRAQLGDELPIIALASHVPEEAEEDENLRAAILDAALAAAAAQLTGRVVDVEPHDA